MTDLDTDLDRDAVERRLDAVERALSEDEPVERAERLDDLEARVAELEAAVQAIRGYVGSVRAVNEEIEHRADLALRTARAVRRHVAPGSEDGSDPGDPVGATGPIGASGGDRTASGEGDGGDPDSGSPDPVRALSALRRRL